jgi:hypothetical protein
MFYSYKSRNVGSAGPRRHIFRVSHESRNAGSGARPSAPSHWQRSESLAALRVTGSAPSHWQRSESLAVLRVTGSLWLRQSRAAAGPLVLPRLGDSEASARPAPSETSVEAAGSNLQGRRCGTVTIERLEDGSGGGAGTQ